MIGIGNLIENIFSKRSGIHLIKVVKWLCALRSCISHDFILSHSKAANKTLRRC